jgi:hypothetical protein
MPNPRSGKVPCTWIPCINFCRYKAQPLLRLDGELDGTLVIRNGAVVTVVALLMKSWDAGF